MSETRVNCIFCQIHGKTEDTKRHLYINTETQLFYCQRCGERGKWDGDVPISFDSSVFAKSRFDDIDIFPLYGGFVFSIPNLKRIRDGVAEYISKRLPPEVIEKKCYWSPDIPTRVFFPLFVGGKIVMWQARTIEDGVKPKYLTWGKCSEYIYGFEDIMEDWATLCEGPISALSSPNGLALFGKHLSDTQLLLIASKFNKIYLAKEKGAEDDWLEIKKSLDKYVETIQLDLGDKDPNDLQMEKMKEIINARHN